MATEELTILGHRVEGSIEPDQMELIPVSHLVKEVTFKTGELTAMCPVTNQPDLYSMALTYLPEGFALESKSLKLYLMRFRNRGIFGEDLAAEIARDVQGKVHSRWTEVALTQQKRGGLEMEVRAVADEDAV